MNASATLRASFIRSSGFPLESSRFDPAHRRRIIQELDYIEYKIQCELERKPVEPTPTPTNYDAKTPSRWVHLRHCLTHLPYRDMNWIVAIMFVVGSVSFTISGFFGLLPFTAPSTVFEGQLTVALPVSIDLGAVLFLTAGFFSIFAAFNANRGTITKKIDEDSTDGDRVVYCPALLGSSAWIWMPSASELRSLLGTIPFCSGLMQLFGGLILTVSVIASLPGVLDPSNLFFMQLFIFLPQILGGLMFFLANIMLAVFVQERWYKPKPLRAEWQGAMFNSLGGLGLILGGGLALLNDLFSNAIVSFIGNWGFLIGSILQFSTYINY